MIYKMLRHIWVLYVLSWLYRLFVLLILVLLPAQWSKKLNEIATTLPRDVKALYVAIRLAIAVFFAKSNDSTAYSEFKKLAKANPDRTCYVFGEQAWTFKMVDDYTAKVANAFSALGFERGDIVCIFMSTQPEYVFLWLGLSRLGVISALLNSNLQGRSLKHCIETVNCKAIIFSEDLYPAILEVKHTLSESKQMFQLRGQSKGGVSDLAQILSEASCSFCTSIPIKTTSHLVYVFTSGTTGMPKAAIFTHLRFLAMAKSAKMLLNLKSDDRIYNPLPLYHVAGGLFGVCMTTVIGCTTVLAQRFSATNYIPDCKKYECTISMFIGEMCRYVLATPCQPEEQNHNLRTIITTGLRQSVWERFVKRFDIPDAREIYGSTEGNVTLVNFDNKVGAVGFIPRWLPSFIRRRAAVLVKFDTETQELVRNQEGFCIECDTGETGMLLGLIPEDPSHRTFSGYLNQGEAEDKVARKVFHENDKAFITGDLMTMDKDGYLYFKDRIGDSYRWKGENVSSFEVETMINNVYKHLECIVYGVQIGDTEGKAGMVAIVDPLREVDLHHLSFVLEKNLPRYAIPVFVRIVPKIDLTGTFRMKKGELKKESFNPDVVKDPIFFRQGKTYIELTPGVYEGIMNGTIIV